MVAKQTILEAWMFRIRAEGGLAKIGRKPAERQFSSARARVKEGAKRIEEPTLLALSQA